MLALLTVITLWLTTCKQIPRQLQISHWRWGDPLIVRISLSAIFSPVSVTESHCVDNVSLLVSVLHLPGVTVSPLASLPRLSQARRPAEPGSDQGAPWTTAWAQLTWAPHDNTHEGEGEMNEKCNTYTTQCHTRLSCIRYFSSVVIVFVFAPRHLVFLPLLKVSEPMSSQKKTNECRQILICKGMPGLGRAMWCRCVSFSSWIILTGFSKVAIILTSSWLSS